MSLALLFFSSIIFPFYSRLHFFIVSAYSSYTLHSWLYRQVARLRLKAILKTHRKLIFFARPHQLFSMAARLISYVDFTPFMHPTWIACIVLHVFLVCTVFADPSARRNHVLLGFATKLTEVCARWLKIHRVFFFFRHMRPPYLLQVGARD